MISPPTAASPPIRPEGDIGFQVTVKIDGVLRTLWLSRRTINGADVFSTPSTVRLGFPVGQMVQQLVGDLSDLPEVVKAAKVDCLEMRRSSGGSESSGRSDFTFGLEFVTQYGSSQESTLQLKLILGKTAAGATFSLMLRLGDPLDPVEFDLTLNNGGLFARLQQSSNPKRFTLAPLGNILSPELGALMGAVEITPLEIAIGHDKTSGSYVLAAQLAGEVALSQLPFVGERLPKNVDLSIKNLGLVWCSAHLSQDEAARDRIRNALDGVELLKPLSESDGTTLDPLLVGGLFKATLTVPAATAPILLQLPLKSKGTAPPSALPAGPVQDQPRQPGNAAAAPATTTPAKATTSTTSVAITTGPDAGLAKWFEVNKTIGPLSLRRLGLAYAKERVWFLFDTSINAGAVTLIVDGLGAGLNPFDLLGGRFDPAYTLRGLGLVIKGPAEISGAFLRDRIADPRGDYDEFSGVILVKTEALTISGIGSYADPPWGDPSLFAYAFLDKPIGGPAFFFVTGLALGLAINRNLDLPPIDQVAQFPLVRLALGDDLFPPRDRPQIRPTSDSELTRLLEVQQAMKPYTRPQSGQIAFAVGVRFTTFQLLNSFGLLVASFGKPFKLDLLISSRLEIPARPPGNQSSSRVAIAQVGIDLRGTWIPEKGFLMIEGRITEGSWFLDSSCRLSGGAAFAAWMAGAHKGDFVMTVGGYHPKFPVPAHYPQVPRLAFNLSQGPIEIKGNAYFAMTPSALMVGGSFSATFRQGRFKAWYTYGADFLVMWEPFAYDAMMFIEVGASYRTAFGTIGASVGARLHLWGPDLAGIATVDLRVVKFNIRFGNSKNAPPKPISAAAFKERFLPADEDLISIGIRDGLVRADTNRDIPLFVVNPAEFTLAIESVIPLPQQHEEPLGIGPMGVTSKAFDTNDTKQVVNYEITHIFQGQRVQVTENFRSLKIHKPVPAALWGPAPSEGKVRRPDFDPQKVVVQAVVGYQLMPPPPPDPSEHASDTYSADLFHFNTDTWKDDTRERRNPAWPTEYLSWQPISEKVTAQEVQKILSTATADNTNKAKIQENALFAALVDTAAIDPTFSPDITPGVPWLDDLQNLPNIGTLSTVTS